MKGFTLIEVLVVIGIIILLAVALIPQLVGGEEAGRAVETQVRMQTLQTAVDTFERRYGYYPPDNFDDPEGKVVATFGAVITQIVILDVVFSLDSVITAIGMADDVRIMVAAVVIAVGIMLIAVGPVSRFVEAHPTVKMLALSFLLLIGMSLVADGVGFHIPKGYIYFAMGFSVFVEFLNLRVRQRRMRASQH